MEIQQLWDKQECDSWLRKLNSIQQENILSKHMLADLLKKDIGSDTLEQVEYFQNQFLNIDTVIAILRHDVAALGKVEHHDNAAGEKRDKLRVHIKKMEKEFDELKFKFNKYLAAAV